MSTSEVQKDGTSLEYKPREWEELFITNHGDKFEKSVDLLRKLENISEEEATKKLMKIITQTILVEKLLAFYGQQTSEELFENIRKIAGEQTIPFESHLELQEFARHMDTLFIYENTKQKFRNTGIGYRHFCRYIKQRVELGDLVNDETIDKIMEDYYDTIELPPPTNEQEKRRIIFMKRDVLLDLHSLRRFARRTSGFSFENSQLLFQSNSNNLALVLPALVCTFETPGIPIVDKSREVSGSFRATMKLQYARFVLGYIVSHPVLSDVAVTVNGFDKLKEKENTIVEKMRNSEMWFFKGHVAYNKVEPIEVFQMWPIVGDPFLEKNGFPLQKTQPDDELCAKIDTSDFRNMSTDFDNRANKIIRKLN